MPRYRSRRSRKRKRYSRKKRTFKRKSRLPRKRKMTIFTPRYRKMDFPIELRTRLQYKQNGHLINAGVYSYQLVNCSSLYDPMYTNGAFPDFSTAAYYYLLTAAGPYTNYLVTKCTVTYHMMNQGAEPVNYWVAAAHTDAQIDTALEMENRPGVKWGQLPAHSAQVKPTRVSLTTYPRRIHPRRPLLDLVGAYNSSPTYSAYQNLFVEYADGATTGIEVNCRITINFTCQLFGRVFGTGF